MADMVRENEQRLAAYTEQLKEKDDRIKALEQVLRTLKNSSETSSANHEPAAKVDRNDLAEIHRRYVAVLSTLNEKKCSLNNAFRLAGTACSTIRDFIGIAELKIVNEVIFAIFTLSRGVGRVGRRKACWGGFRGRVSRWRQKRRKVTRQ